MQHTRQQSFPCPVRQEVVPVTVHYVAVSGIGDDAPIREITRIICHLAWRCQADGYWPRCPMRRHQAIDVP